MGASFLPASARECQLLTVKCPSCSSTDLLVADVTDTLLRIAVKDDRDGWR
jgi:hypothetical protein